MLGKGPGLRRAVTAALEKVEAGLAGSYAVGITLVVFAQYGARVLRLPDPVEIVQALTTLAGSGERRQRQLLASGG